MSGRKSSWTDEEYNKIILDRIKNKTVHDGNCWRYTGAHNETGYGKITYRSKNIRVSRFIAYIYHGLILDYTLTTKIVCHKPECKFRDCWNPDHLYIGTPEDNMQDRVRDIYPIHPRASFYKRTELKHG